MDNRELNTCFVCETDYYYPGSCTVCTPWRPENIDDKINEVIQELKRRKKAGLARRRESYNKMFYGKLV